MSGADDTRARDTPTGTGEMTDPMRDRCLDCGYWLSAHVTVDGRFLGCPLRLASQPGDEALPRITVRVGKAGSRKGHTIVAWPDSLDMETKQIIVWNMTTGEQGIDDRAALQRNTRRASHDTERTMQDEVEYQIGGRVRVIAGNWPAKA